MISQDRSVWDALLAKQRLKYPVPPWLNPASSSSVPLSSVDLERAVLATHRVAQAWPQARPVPFRVQPRQGDMLLWLEIFIDRWLLVVYAEGLAYLWDTVSDPMAPPGSLSTNSRIRICAKLVDEHENRARWTSCAAQVSDGGEKLIVLLNMRPTTKPYCCVYEVALKANSSFKLLTSVRLNEPEIIRTISFHDNILLLSRGSAINLVDISNKPSRDILVLSPYSDDLEDMWNATLELRVFHRYVFVFKARSFEVHSLDSLLNTTQHEITATPISQHLFQNTTFREVKVSNPTQPTVAVGDIFDIQFQVFAYDVLQGLFHYSIRFQALPEQPPHFTITLPGIYPLTAQLASHYSRLLPEPDLLTPSPTPTNEARHAFRSVMNPSSRGFVSAYAVGSQGRRAVWVERIRGSTTREVHVWSRPGTTDDETIPGEPPKEIERIPVFSIASPDLREDITRCALSESMGLIVLGNRAGELFMLDVDA